MNSFVSDRIYWEQMSLDPSTDFPHTSTCWRHIGTNMFSSTWAWRWRMEIVYGAWGWCPSVTKTGSSDYKGSAHFSLICCVIMSETRPKDPIGLWRWSGCVPLSQQDHTKPFLLNFLKLNKRLQIKKESTGPFHKLIRNPLVSMSQVCDKHKGGNRYMMLPVITELVKWI